MTPNRHTISLIDFIEMWIEPGTDTAIMAAAYYEMLSPRSKRIVRREVFSRKRLVDEARRRAAAERSYANPCSTWTFEKPVFSDPSHRGLDGGWR